MVSSPLNPKIHYHVRSISLPSRAHPFFLQVDEHLCRLKASEATPSSSSITKNLNGLVHLYDCVDEFLQLSVIQQALADQECGDKWVNEVFDGSLRLLDVCGTAKDVLLQFKERVQELESILRRRAGNELELATEAAKYLSFKKRVNKVINKSLKELRSKCTFSSLDKDHGSEEAMVSMLREVEGVTLAVFESLLSLLSKPKAESKSNHWSLISKWMQTKLVEWEEDMTEISEMEMVDAALYALISRKARKTGNMQIEKAQSELGKLGSSIQDLEEGLECLLRRLIKARVSLLNILNH